MRRRASSPAWTMRMRDAVSWRLDSAFAMPSATSSANDASRVSAPAGNGRGFVVDIATAPHMRPSIITGAATAAWAPMRRTYSAVPAAAMSG